MKMEEAVKFLREYDGEKLKFMEVCGSHTAAIFKSGIRELLSSKIQLISGPGCPVCVTPTAYIDKCIEYAQKEGHVLMTFGDMMKVPGSKGTLTDAKARGGRVEMMYAPEEVVKRAIENPHVIYVLAAVGFETTAPVHALALEEAISRGIKNIKLLTALKTILPALEMICKDEAQIDGFICPGHVSVIVGSKSFEKMAFQFKKPFVVTGFEPEHILAGVFALTKMAQSTEERELVRNLYPNVVKPEGNQKALSIIHKYFKPGTATWRGLGALEDSGYYLREEFREYDAGSYGLEGDSALPESCKCNDVILGRMAPGDCPLFGKSCNPSKPCGPCMVSPEGACGIWFRNGGYR